MILNKTHGNNSQVRFFSLTFTDLTTDVICQTKSEDILNFANFNSEYIILAKKLLYDIQGV